MKRMKQMRVSESISIEDVGSWNKGDIITITAPTGKGKSHFIKNSVYDLAKKNGKRILFLVHRKNCFDQFKWELEKDSKNDVIHLKTYHSIDRQNSNKAIEDFDFSPYSYICGDEFHYWLSDSSFNKTTDISLEAILKETNAIKIFMSATSTYMKKYLKEFRNLKTIDYELKDKTNFIKRLEFFYDKNVMESYLDEAIEKRIKAIFFIDNTEKAYELHRKYKNETIFNCAENNKFYKHVNKQQIKDLLTSEGFGKVDADKNTDSTFGKLVLITTSVLDSGVNIRQDDLSHIVVDVKDTEKLIQCIGRKRRKENEKIILCIKAIGNQNLGGIESTARNNNAKADYLKKYGQVEYINKYGREEDKSGTVYLSNREDQHAELKVNDMRYTHNLIKYHEMQYIKGFNSKNNYCEYIKYKLNAVDYLIYDVEKTADDLDSYLNGIVGKRLIKDDQKELIEKINLKDGRGRIQKSINLLNAYFKENKMCFLIKPIRTSERVNGKPQTIRYWEVENNMDY